MAQPARQLTQREYVRRQRRIENQPEPITLPKRRVTKGEKILWSMAAITLLILSIMIVGKQAHIYENTKAVSDLEQKISTAEKTNKDLQVQVQDLQQPERIINFAKENGLKLNTNNVKLVNK